jgi:hypothetical protein
MGGTGLSSKTLRQPVQVTNPPGVNIDVLLGDQTTPAFDAYFGFEKNTTTLDADASKEDTTLTFAAGHGAINGDGILIINTTAFFAKITNVAVNTITIDTPLSADFSSGDTVTINDIDISNANGSLVAPVVYDIELPSIGLTIDVTRIMIQMITASGVSLAEFGDIVALTNGIVLRKVPATGDNIVYWNIKNNAEFGLHAYDLTLYNAAGPFGTDGLSVRSTFAGQDKRGVAVRLGVGDALQLLVQDDLRGITTFNMLAEGHVVLD